MTSPEPEDTSAPISPPSSLSPLSPRVVVVDDDPSIVEALEGLLRSEGFAVEGFTDPSSALDHLRDGPPPSLILIDCVMPRLSGAELVAELAEAGVDAPVVLMTALSDPSFCVHPGRASVLNKPFAVDDLLAEIGSSMRPPRSSGRTVRI